MHCAYAPFGALLQHAAVIVYNGGIGTCGQAFRAGVPQVSIFFARILKPPKAWFKH